MFPINLQFEILVATNRYAAENKHCSRFEDWKDLEIEELKCFFGVLFHMALSHRPNREMYWGQVGTGGVARPSSIRSGVGCYTLRGHGL